jgi:glyoxylase-like metal-dependent hydrolase (beta-lactamase superfamily II)
VPGLSPGSSQTSPVEIGNVVIHRIVEQEGPFFSALQFFPSLTPERLSENRAWMQPRYLDAADNLQLCIQSYLLRTPHYNILIDTCVGNDKPRPLRSFWHMMNSDRYARSLADAEVTVEDIDFVMCTHLHVDHVGWNTRLDRGRWVPTFPKARYVFARGELDYWTMRQAREPEACPWVTDSVLPILATNRADIVSSAHAFDDLVTLFPTPGHTIDHFSVQVGKTGADAIIIGDMVHSPLQARYPELGMMSDYDSRQSEETRRTLFERVCDTATLMCTAHFPSPSVGRVVRWRDSFEIVST